VARSAPEVKAIEPRASSLGRALRARIRSSSRRGWGLAAALAVGLVALAAAAGAEASGLGLLALAALLTVFHRPVFLGPLAALLLPAGERLHVLGAQVAPLEAVVGGGALGYLVALVVRRDGVGLGVAHGGFAALLAAMMLSMLGPVDTSDRARELLFWGALAVVFAAVTEHARTRLGSRLLLVGLASSTLVEVTAALVQYLARWEERFVALGGAIVHPLPSGTLEHPNALAQFLVLAALTVLALALRERGPARSAGIAVAALGSLALVVTFSRASWIAFVLGAAVYLVERRSRVPALVAGMLAAIAATALVLANASAIGARISSLFDARAGDLYDFRLELLQRAAAIVSAHPLTGAGHFEEAGVYVGRPDVATHPHNFFLGVAVFFGIPAALAFAWIVLAALGAAWKGYRARTGYERLVSLGFLAALVAFLANGLLEYPLWNPSLATLLVLVLAAAVTVNAGTKEGGRTAIGAPPRE
jgi:O-antigen ligase